MKYTYPDTVWLKFKGRGLLPRNDGDEWRWMQECGERWGHLLQNNGVGFNDGSGGGGGYLDIYFFVNDISTAVQLLKDQLIDEELIQYSVILSHKRGAASEDWPMHWPDAAPAWAMCKLGLPCLECEADMLMVNDAVFVKERLVMVEHYQCPNGHHRVVERPAIKEEPRADEG